MMMVNPLAWMRFWFEVAPLADHQLGNERKSVAEIPPLATGELSTSKKSQKAGALGT
jgi:hypothetical protein